MHRDQPLRPAGGDRQPTGRARAGGRGAAAGRERPAEPRPRLPHRADHPSRPRRRSRPGGPAGRPIAPDAVLGVVAAGSGCDFVRSFGLPGDAVQAARHLAGDRVRAIDVGSVTCTDGDALTTRYFVNIAEAGLGGAVVARAAGLKRVGRFLGSARYATGFWLTLPGLRPAAV